jgi:hypothetical protein
MTEEEIIDLGFEKVDILHDESQNGYDYYYYHKEVVPNLALHSTDSDDVQNNHWQLKCFEIPSVQISTSEEYLRFVNAINPNMP